MNKLTLVRFLPTASALGRGKACLPSQVLPRAKAAPRVYTTKGSGTHKFIETTADGVKAGKPLEDARATALEAVPLDAPERALCEAVPFEELPPLDKCLIEQAMAYNCETDTAEILGRVTDRAYPDRGDAVYVGTPDLMGVEEVLGERELVIGDWKTGYQTVAVDESWQGKLLCLAGARALDCQRARFIHYHLREDGGVYRSTATYDALALDEIAEELRSYRLALLAEAERYRASGEHSPTVPGDHCTYCESYAYCPSKRNVLVAIGGGCTDLVKITGTALTHDHVARAQLALEEFKSVAKRVQEEIDGYVWQNDARVELGDGRVLCLAPGAERDVIDGAKAMPLFREHYGEEVALASFELKGTKTAINAAVGAWAKANGRKVGVTQKEALKLLTDAGACTKKPGEVKPRIVAADKE